MPEHRIRFRAGWQVEGLPGILPPYKFQLPTRWPAGSEEIVRLVRRFGRPPVRDTGERYLLDFQSVPGLVSLKLNGEVWTVPEAPAIGFRVELVDPLLERNVLELEVDLDRASKTPCPDGWGEIALVIVEES